MMMISSNRRKSPLRALLVVAAVVLVVGVVFVLRGPLTNLVWALLGPVGQWRYAASDALLRAELASTTALVADRDALYRENVDLKARLGRAGAAPARILGAVLLRPPATPYDTLVIDAGARSGVAVGDVVAAGGTTVIGVVSDVYDATARIKLYSAPGESYDALLRPSAQAAGIPLTINGQGGGSLRAQVPTGTLVAVGDEALLPGIAGGIMARVSHVEHGDSESYVTVYFTLPVNAFDLRYVEVWKR